MKIKDYSDTEILVRATIVVLIMLGVNYGMARQYSVAQAGQFGDIFGLTNAIFSGLAFVGVLYTILQQNESAKEQRLQNERTKREFMASMAAVKGDRFDQTFFQMLSFHNSIVGDLEYRDVKGRNVFKVVRLDLIEWTMMIDVDASSGEGEPEWVTTPRGLSNITACKELIENDYDKGFYLKFEGLLNHYYRNLYHIYKFVHTSDLIGDIERKRYASLIRAQLSQDELYALMFNSMKMGYGNPKFLYLAKKYDILKNFRRSATKPKLFNELYDDMLLNVEQQQY